MERGAVLESREKKRERVEKIYGILEKEFPEAACTLRFKNPYELLTATILAAQCTDARVNKVTPALFERYPDAGALCGATSADVEKKIASTGFFRNKTRSLLGMAKALVEKHGGEVPGEMEALVALPGVGRKTANVVLGNCFGRPALVVDTHFKRLSGRLGLSKESNPDKIEVELGRIVPEERQTMWSHFMVFHGRNVCAAKKPKCPECGIIDLCPWCDKTA